MNQTTLKQLRDMPIFGGLHDDTLEFILDQSPAVKVSCGDYFFYEGDQAQSMFVLQQGTVSILKAGTRCSHKLRLLGQGDCFGEISIITICPRSASVMAVEDCTAITISTKLLYDLHIRDAEQFSIINMNITREICRRLKNSEKQNFENHPSFATPPANQADYTHSNFTPPL